MHKYEEKERLIKFSKVKQKMVQRTVKRGSKKNEF